MGRGHRELVLFRIFDEGEEKKKGKKTGNWTHINDRRHLVMRNESVERKKNERFLVCSLLPSNVRILLDIASNV